MNRRTRRHKKPNYTTNALGKRKRKDVTYRGVIRRGERYQATVYLGNGKSEYIGTFSSGKKAAIQVDRRALQLGKPISELNFPKKQHKKDDTSEESSEEEDDSEESSEDEDATHHPKPRQQQPTRGPRRPPQGRQGRPKSAKTVRSSTGYRGVYKHRDRFIVQISIGRTQKSVGMFRNTLDAARAFDKAVLRYNKPKEWLNFPEQALPSTVQKDTKTKQSTRTSKTPNKVPSKTLKKVPSKSSSKKKNPKKNNKNNKNNKTPKLVRVKPISNSRTGYCGVCVTNAQSLTSSFQCTVRVPSTQKLVVVGTYRDVVDAAIAYDKVIGFIGKATSRTGLNFIDVSVVPDPLTAAGQTLADIMDTKFAQVTVHPPPAKKRKKTHPHKEIQPKKKSTSASSASLAFSAPPAFHVPSPSLHTFNPDTALQTHGTTFRPALGYNGVSKNKKGYTATIYVNQRQEYLGTFRTALEAAIAHDQYVLKLQEKRNPPVLLEALNFPAGTRPVVRVTTWNSTGRCAFVTNIRKTLVQHKGRRDNEKEAEKRKRCSLSKGGVV